MYRLTRGARRPERACVRRPPARPAARGLPARVRRARGLGASAMGSQSAALGTSLALPPPSPAEPPTATSLSEPTDINVLHDLKDELDEAEVDRAIALAASHHGRPANDR